ncbi:MAG: biotin transporter BioY [Gudongella sp.]|nr:biotin transporter BioY [Gudongella sp.]
MKISTREITLISLFSALTAIGAFISIPLGPVPITLQTLFVLLAGFLLSPRSAALSQIVYIGIGLAGVPIFSGFTGGLQAILKPSFGFLVGFVIASIIASVLSKRHHTPVGFFVAGAVATFSMYIVGIPYMAFILNYVMDSGFSFMAILNMGLLLFLPGDLLKLFVATYLGSRLGKILQKK